MRFAPQCGGRAGPASSVGCHKVPRSELANTHNDAAAPGQVPELRGLEREASETGWHQRTGRRMVRAMVVGVAAEAPRAADGFLDRLKTRALVCDGAMGTLLHAAGVSLGRALPELNVTQPALVRSIHAAYIEAGADILETNTFGASRQRLARHGLGTQVAAINRAAVQLAREARELAERPVLIAGSVSPVTPPGYRGGLSSAAIRESVREQVEALAREQVDLLILETFGSLTEMTAAADEAGCLVRLPLVAQMTFLPDGLTPAGESPTAVARALEGVGVTALGINCTLGPQGLLAVLGELALATSLPLAAQPNAGPPILVDGHFRYTDDPAYFARYARRFVEQGAVLVGGCCGTTPAHISAMATAVAGLPPSRHFPPVAGPPSPVPVDLAGTTHSWSTHRAPLPPARGRGGKIRPRVVRPSDSTASVRPLSPSSTPAPEPPRFARRLADGQFLVACEIAPPLAADPEQAVREARQLRDTGCAAVVVGVASTTRPHVSPVSAALLVQQQVPELDVVLTATTWEKSVISLQADLLGAHAFGIRPVVCRSGTPPLQGDYPHTDGIWEVDSIGLLEILGGLNEGRDYNGIPLGRPTAFVTGARINPSARNLAYEVLQARRKVEAGVSFLLTPPLFDLEALERFLDAVGTQGVPPVLVGIMPLRDLAHAEYLQHEVPDMAVPAAVSRRLARAGAHAAEAGLEIAVELANGARRRGRAQGIVASSAIGSATELVRLMAQAAS